MFKQTVYADRYTATGTPYPDPETMCEGQCDGMGCYPHRQDSRDETPEERRRWHEAHQKRQGHDEQTGRCDGWHFITCPDCEGTGRCAA